ncbi:hypothetical protein ODU07_04770 [Streptococcus suis]|uniref:hypothetical protein n=1 Tax=Streptococcus sp. ZY1909104 TaxID=3233335 RepID=UPI0014327680|nr:hypothetical protein [Streptococcus suis]
MKYDKKDLFCDYLSLNSILEHAQDYRLNAQTWVYLFTLSKNELNEFDRAILTINKTCRITRNSYSPYTLHKPFPSARSYYPERVWISLGKGHFLSYFENDDSYKVYYNEEAKEVEAASVLLSTEDIQVAHYRAIHNSLITLELGHIIYNIECIFNIFGFSILVDSLSMKRYIIIQKGESVEDNLTFKNLVEVKRLFQLRSSGSYRYKLINLDNDFTNYQYTPAINLETSFKKLFASQLKGIIQRVVLYNNGEYFTDSNGEYIVQFFELNREYYFVDFRTASQYTLLLIKLPPIQDELIDYILFMGYLAQEICINNAGLGRYNRPVKQVNFTFWKNILGDKYKDFLPFYGVITGKESVLSGKREVVYDDEENS